VVVVVVVGNLYNILSMRYAVSKIKYTTMLIVLCTIRYTTQLHLKWSSCHFPPVGLEKRGPEKYF
jgi:hypothetical protein